jgi:hypothetical protein
LCIQIFNHQTYDSRLENIRGNFSLSRKDRKSQMDTTCADNKGYLQCESP